MSVSGELVNPFHGVLHRLCLCTSKAKARTRLFSERSRLRRAHDVDLWGKARGNLQEVVTRASLWERVGQRIPASDFTHTVALLWPFTIIMYSFKDSIKSCFKVLNIRLLTFSVFCFLVPISSLISDGEARIKSPHCKFLLENMDCVWKWGWKDNQMAYKSLKNRLKAHVLHIYDCI